MPPGWIIPGTPESDSATPPAGAQDPVIEFYSTQNGSGGNVTWDVTLPTDRNATANQSDLYEAVEFGMVVTAPSGWMDQCFLQLQLYPDASWTRAGSVPGNWIGTVVGWQVNVTSGVEDPCFYTPLYAGTDVPGSGFLNLTQGDRINVTMTGWPGDSSGELLTIKDLTHTANQSFTYAINRTGYPLDPAYSANDVPDALQWSTGGDLPVTFSLLTGRAGNPSVPDNNTNGGCSPGAPPSTAANPSVPCPSYDPGSWINDTLHPWEIDSPTFFNGTSRSGPPAQVSFSQAYGGADEVAATEAACAGRVGSAYCSYPWFSYSCAVGAFEFGATDYPGVSDDFGQYGEYSTTLEHNPAQMAFYPAVSYSVPTCAGPSYHLVVGPAMTGGSVVFLNHNYTSSTELYGLSPGTYQVNVTPPTGEYFSDWIVTGSVVLSMPHSPWTAIALTGNGTLLASYSNTASLVTVTFDDSPSGQIAVSPGWVANSEGTTMTAPSGSSLQLTPGVYAILAYPPEGFDFANWSSPGNGLAVGSFSSPLTWIVVTGTEASASITADYTVSVHFDRVAVGAYDPANATFGGGTVSFGGFLTTTTIEASGWIAVGTYSLGATPEPGFQFGGWYYTESSMMLNFTSSTNIVLENGTLNKTLRAGIVLAIFTPDPVDITFSIEGGTGGVAVSGYGYVKSGGTLALVPGENYTMSAAPGATYRFVSWTSLEPKVVWNRAPGIWTEQFVVNGTGTVIGNYAMGGPTILGFQINPVGAGTITFDATDSYSNGMSNSSVVAGATYLDSAVPSPGFTFSEWNFSGDVTPEPENSANSSVTVSGMGDLNATFVPTTFPVTFLTNSPQLSLLKVDGSALSIGSTLPLAPGAHTISIRTPTGTTFDTWSSTSLLAVEAPNSNQSTVIVSGPGALTALVTPFAVGVPSITPTQVDIGISVNFVAPPPTGGSYVGFSPTWTGLPEGCPSGVGDDTLACAPTTSGQYDISVTFTDVWGEPATSPVASLTVNPDPSLSNVALSHAAIDAGVPTNLSATVIGGTGPFSWTYVGLPGGCFTVNESMLSCSPSETGAFNVTVNVSDKFGKTAGGVVHLVVNPLPSVQFESSSQKISFGSPVTLTATPSGGTAPINLNYSGLPPGCPTTVATSFSCVPTSVGTFHISVTATDAFGKNATQVLTLVVSRSAPSIWGLFSTELAIGLALLVIIAIVVFVALRRRPKKPTIVATPAAPIPPSPRSSLTRPSAPAPRPEWSEEPPAPTDWEETH